MQNSATRSYVLNPKNDFINIRFVFFFFYSLFVVVRCRSFPSLCCGCVHVYVQRIVCEQYIHLACVHIGATRCASTQRNSETYKWSYADARWNNKQQQQQQRRQRHRITNNEFYSSIALETGRQFRSTRKTVVHTESCARDGGIIDARASHWHQRIRERAAQCCCSSGTTHISVRLSVSCAFIQRNVCDNLVLSTHFMSIHRMQNS